MRSTSPTSGGKQIKLNFNNQQEQKNDEGGEGDNDIEVFEGIIATRAWRAFRLDYEAMPKPTQHLALAVMKLIADACAHLLTKDRPSSPGVSGKQAMALVARDEVDRQQKAHRILSEARDMVEAHVVKCCDEADTKSVFAVQELVVASLIEMMAVDEKSDDNSVVSGLTSNSELMEAAFRIAGSVMPRAVWTRSAVLKSVEWRDMTDGTGSVLVDALHLTDSVDFMEFVVRKFHNAIASKPDMTVAEEDEVFAAFWQVVGFLNKNSIMDRGERRFADMLSDSGITGSSVIAKLFAITPGNAGLTPVSKNMHKLFQPGMATHRMDHVAAAIKERHKTLDPIDDDYNEAVIAIGDFIARAPATHPLDKDDNEALTKRMSIFTDLVDTLGGGVRAAFTEHAKSLVTDSAPVLIEGMGTTDITYTTLAGPSFFAALPAERQIAAVKAMAMSPLLYQGLSKVKWADSPHLIAVALEAYNEVFSDDGRTYPADSCVVKCMLYDSGKVEAVRAIFAAYASNPHLFRTFFSLESPLSVMQELSVPKDDEAKDVFAEFFAKFCTDCDVSKLNPGFAFLKTHPKSMMSFIAGNETEAIKGVTKYSDRWIELMNMTVANPALTKLREALTTMPEPGAPVPAPKVLAPPTPPSPARKAAKASKPVLADDDVSDEEEEEEEGDDEEQKGGNSGGEEPSTDIMDIAGVRGRNRTKSTPSPKKRKRKASPSTKPPPVRTPQGQRPKADGAHAPKRHKRPRVCRG